MPFRVRFLRSAVVVLVGLLAPLAVEAQEASPAKTEEPRRGPLTYKEPKSGVLFYVESDRRHVSAVDRDGKVLWHKDPFVEAKLRPYRVKEPKIVFVGAANESSLRSVRGKGDFIGIAYTSSQFGVLNMATGDFTFLGND